MQYEKYIFFQFLGVLSTQGPHTSAKNPNEEKSKKMSSDIDEFKTFKDSIDKKIKMVQDTFESSLNEGLKSC